MLKIKKGDTVQVMAGKDRGTQGEVLLVIPATGRVIVEGVNLMTRHIKAKDAMSKGERVKKEASIDMSNVAIIDPETKKPTRVGFLIKDDGSKVRVAKKSGKEIA